MRKLRDDVRDVRPILSNNDKKDYPLQTPLRKELIQKTIKALFSNHSRIKV